MSHILDWVKSVSRRINAFAGRYFTPKEFRSFLLFIACGIAVLLYRGGKNLISHYFPSLKDSSSKIIEHRNDSLFALLSRKDFVRDSLQFWMPEDSSIGKKESFAHSGRSKKELSLKTEQISLNTSGKDSLSLLPGIGEKTAERILSYRNERGRFRRLHELTNVSGIGEKKFKRVEPYLRLN
jgi:competence ComEA-like helix-hairpin-helix protein